MLSRTAKNLYYIVAGPPMRLNGWRHRLFNSSALSENEPLRLHLGPGQERYIPGWVNIDANMFTGKCDVWADLRNPLPYQNGTTTAVYSHHVIEHLPNIEAHFEDVYRVLKPGGVYRVGGPSGDSAIKKFLEGDHSWFGDWPDKYESIGGRMVNFLLCRNEHLTILTESLLREIGQRAGFREATKQLPVKESQFPDLFGECLEKEHETDFDTPRTLIMEFQK